MKAAIGLWTGYLGMTIAVVGGATWPEPSYALVGGGLLVVAIGIAIKRKAGVPPLEAAAGGPARRPSEVVAEVHRRVKELAVAAPDMPLETIKNAVDEIILEGVQVVARSQAGIVGRLGFPAYAEVMGPLATAERLLNRAWSAAADGHRPETLESLRQAEPYAEEADRLAAKAFASL